MGTSASAAYRASALDIRRLSLFLAVVEHGGFTRAAQAVHISQPALSQAIAELEGELRGPLFHRLGHKVTLTDAGAALVGPARAVLREIDAARQATDEVNKLSRGRLDLSALPTLSTDPLPALLGAFRRAHPAVTVRIASPADPDELAEQVRSGVAEVGVTDAGRAPDGLTAVPLCAQQMVAVLPPGTSRPAGPMRPTGLADVPLIVTPAGSSGRRLLDAALARAGIRPLIAIETSQREAILPLVIAGAGAAVMPQTLAALAVAQGAIAVGFDPPMARDLVVVSRAGTPTPPAAAFLAVAARLARQRRSLVPGSFSRARRGAWMGPMGTEPEVPLVVSASCEIAAGPERIFELIADPARQPGWDGNNNLRAAPAGQRVRRTGEVFTMTLTNGDVRENHVVEFDEGRLMAWTPAEPGRRPPGHLWRWELEPAGASRTRVTCTYDWTRLTDSKRFPRARATTAERLRSSLDRLAAMAEGA